MEWDHRPAPCPSRADRQMELPDRNQKRVSWTTDFQTRFPDRKESHGEAQAPAGSQVRQRNVYETLNMQAPRRMTDIFRPTANGQKKSLLSRTLFRSLK